MQYKALAVPGLAILLLLGCTSTRSQSESDFSIGTGPLPPFHDRLLQFAELNLDQHMDVLVLSGGGQNGAYGAGVAKGWGDVGRPRFDVITGVSTGALLSSFYFLDAAEADDLLKQFYTNVRKGEIACRRSLIGTLTSDAVLDSAPLKQLIARVLDDALIDRIAEASEGGKRLLLVSTTNMDSGGLRVWDMGALARHKQYDRYRAVVLASASPPGGMPPVYIDGDMHVDGGTRANVFLPYAEHFISREEYNAVVAKSTRPDAKEIWSSADLYVVMNRVLTSPAQRTEAKFVPIVRRGLDLLMDGVAQGSLWYVYALSRRDGAVPFHLTSIPESLEADAADAFAFDPASMRRLYAAGVEAGRKVESWADRPPTIQPDLR